MLITKWGKALDKNHPLCEYPRPQFVRDSFHPKHIFPVYIEL